MKKIPRWGRWVIGAAVVVVIALVAGPFIYIHFIEKDPPPRLALSPVTTTTGGLATQSTTSTPSSGISHTPATLTGTWKIGTGTTAGYRVNEVLFGQRNSRGTNVERDREYHDRRHEGDQRQLHGRHDDRDERPVPA